MNNVFRITLVVIVLAIVLQNHTIAQTYPERYSIIISEIMADPTPVIGLPAAEYIELHNRSSNDHTLSGWKIKIGNTVKALPNFSIEGGGYCVIIADKYREEYAFIDSQLVTLSSLSITDGGQSIILYNSDNRVIHSVVFKKDWHTESIKQDGGWSLEMIDTDLPCAGKENWNSSTDESGGTPGRSNSIAQMREDAVAPALSHVTLIDSATLRIFFTEPIQPDLPIPNELFTITPTLSIEHITEVEPYFTAFDIVLTEQPHPNVQYSLSVAGEISDCSGIIVPLGNALPFGIPYRPQAGDLIINEILSHPISGTDADFVEFFNKSSHIIDLKELKIGSGGDTLPSKAIVINGGGWQLMPHQYVAVCKDKSATLQQYYCPDSRLLIDCDTLPSFANSSGVVFLTTRDLRCIDRVAYSDEMHYSGLLNTEGVSLERVCIDCESQDIGNWHSAASSVGYATPGYRNSQFTNELPHDNIDIIPEVFSPNNDGFDDFTNIHLRFQQADNRLTITIFNQQGVAVRHLVNNDLCGTEASYRWDGTDDNQQVVLHGMYIAIIQWWNANGKTKKIKRVVSIW